MKPLNDDDSYHDDGGNIEVKEISDDYYDENFRQ